MEAATANDSQLVRRFNPLRGFRRGLKAACRWTIRFGRGRSSAAPGGRGRRTGRVRGAPLASLSAAMLEPDGILDPGDEPYITPTSGHQQIHTPLVPELIRSADAASDSGSSFPIVLRRPVYNAASPPSPHLHPRRSLQYHVNADDVDLYQLHSPHHHNHNPASLHNLEETSWTHHHTDLRSPPACDCGGWAEGTGCSGRCPAAANGAHAHRRAAGGSCSPTAITSASLNSCRRGDDGSGTGGGGSGGSAICSQQGVGGKVQCQSQGYSLQHLLAVGSRQWGSGGWWDGRGFLRVKIYDFAIYADPAKASYAIRSGGATSPGSRTLDCGGDGPAASNAAAGGGGSFSPAEIVVSPSSRVDMSLTIRACRNLPLHLLSQEFERILQRRHEKAGGRADDPAFQELLSYFSREKLPEHVLTTTTTTMASAGSSVSGGDAVRKGASITFSRSSSGALLTEAGGRVLGLVQSPALAEALFDLYLGDQPVSKKAKAAAGAALLDIAGREGGGDYRYRPRAGERLVCGTGPRGVQDWEACALRVS